MIVFEAPERYRGTIEVYAAYPDFQVLELPKPEWRWRCKSRNGQILAQGEGYRRRSGALNAIDAQYSARLVVTTGVGDNSQRKLRYVVPWRLVVRDRHGDITTTGAVY